MEQKRINGVLCEKMGCCGIFAAALVSGKEPQEVFDAYKPKHNKSGRWKGSTYIGSLKNLMANELGVKFTPIEKGKGKTVRQFYMDYCRPSGTYLVWVSGHVMTIDKGRLIDQWHCEPINIAKKNKCRVECAIEIITATNIPDGKITGTRTKEDQAADHEAEVNAKRDQAAKLLEKGMAKHGLTNKRIAEYRDKKIRLVGYNPRKKRYPFLVEVIEKNGVPCSEYGETTVYSAEQWYSVQTHNKLAA